MTGTTFLHALQNSLVIPDQVKLLLEDKHVVAFVLAFVASLGTLVGACVVLLLTCLSRADGKKKKSSKAIIAEGNKSTLTLMGVLQGFSAGVMLYITCFDLVPEAIEAVGQEAMEYFFLGILIFLLLDWAVHWLEEKNHGISHGHHKHDEDASVDTLATQDMTLLSSGEDEPGSPIRPKPLRSRNVKVAKKSAKAKAADATSPVKQTLPSSPAPTSTSANPNHFNLTPDQQKSLLRSSFITFLAMTLHNIPEGLGVYLSSLSDLRLGIQLALAIALHNIPEGMAVALPIYAATNGSWSSVLGWTALNGLAEPFGVLLGGYLLSPWISNALLSRVLATVGGIMTCISIHELQPTAIQYAGKWKASVSCFSGMAICWLMLVMVDSFFSHSHHHHHHH